MYYNENLGNEYDQQASKFLNKYNLIINIQKAVPQKPPIWMQIREPNPKEHGINYWITISENKTDGKSYSFDVWGSIYDREKNQTPRPYDILACISIENFDSFEDFAHTFGYDIDSRTAERIYKTTKEQDEGLKNLLSVEAIEELNSIN